MARAIAAAERVPVSLTGCCVLGILSATIGAGLEVRSGAQRKTRGNLYLVPSADSGTGKSEAKRHASSPLDNFEQELIDNWKKTIRPRLQVQQQTLVLDMAQAKGELKSATGIQREEIQHRMEKAQARLNELEGELKEPALQTNDATSEAVADLLEKNGETLSSISSDAGKVIQLVLGRYTDGKTDEILYVCGYTGDSVRVHRKSSPPINLKHPCLTVLWLVQRDKIEKLLSERSLVDGGLAPRLLICHTDCQPAHITGEQYVIPGEVLSAYESLIRDLLQTYRQAAEAQTIEPTPAAMQLFTDHHNRIVDRRLSDLKDITSYAARWTEQAWRISVVLHAALHGAQAHEHHLSAETAQNAITIADWFAAQQLDILKGGRWQAKRDQQKEALYLLADIPEGITARDVQRARIAKTPKEASDLLAAMEQDGKLEHRDITPEHGGRTSRLYTRKQGR